MCYEIIYLSIRYSYTYILHCITVYIVCLWLCACVLGCVSVKKQYDSTDPDPTRPDVDVTLNHSIVFFSFYFPFFPPLCFVLVRCYTTHIHSIFIAIVVYCCLPLSLPLLRAVLLLLFLHHNCVCVLYIVYVTVVVCYVCFVAHVVEVVFYLLLFNSLFFCFIFPLFFFRFLNIFLFLFV